MKFETQCKFRVEEGNFEPGNKHDSKELGISEAKVEKWHARGWVCIEGRDKRERRAPQRVSVDPADSVMEEKA